AVSQTPAAPRHTVDDDTKASAGQLALVPVQFSATSHEPAEVRQAKLAALNTSTHALLVPAQWSAASPAHAPPCDAPAHPVVTVARASAGQAQELPVQFSATSHCPAEARHTVLENTKASAGHAALVPVQFSARSQTPVVERQTVVEGAKASTAQLPLFPW